MNILLVDDEVRLLAKLKQTVAAVVPDAALFDFSKAREAIAFSETTPIDIAFLDINMRIITGFELAKHLQGLYPRVNIIFCTGYSEYALDAHDIHCSGYLMKPVTEEKVTDAMAHLRFPVQPPQVEEKTAEADPVLPPKRVQIICFGNFDVIVDGAPLHFKYEKTREVLAYLVDRSGSSVGIKEMSAAIWEDEGHINYLKSLRHDLISVLAEHGCEDILDKSRGRLAILPEKIRCDYYDWKAGLIPASRYTGEYMTQYSWAEYTNAYLQNR